MDKKAEAKFSNFYREQMCQNWANFIYIYEFFHLNIFIFEASASLQTLPQSLKRNVKESA